MAEPFWDVRLSQLTWSCVAQMALGGRAGAQIADYGRLLEGAATIMGRSG
jgi:hypothetical protein